MKIRRRLVSLVTVLILCLSILPPTAFTAGDFIIQDGVLTQYIGTGGNVVIPDGVTKIDDDAFSNCASLTSITIPSSVTEIGSFAFQGCSGLSKVTMGSSVTSINMYAFSYCTNLSLINIPDSVTTIGVNAFLFCSNLTEVTIPASVTRINDGVFWKCTALTEVTIPNGVTYIGATAFAECTNLTHIAIPAGITIMSNAFRNTNIEKVTYLDGTSLSVSEISQFFPNTPLHNQMRYHQKPISTDISMEGAVIKNSILTKYLGSSSSVVIPDGVTVIGDEAFMGCTNLVNVTIPDSVTYIGNWAFAQCTALTSITIPDSVTAIGDCAFAECNKLSSLTIPSKVTSIGNLAFVCTNITSIALPDGIEQFGQYLFQGCEALVSVTFPEDGTTVETLRDWFSNDFGALFMDCKSLEEIKNIPCTEYAEFLSASQAFFNEWVNPGQYVTDQNGQITYTQGAQDEHVVAVSNQITAGLTSDYEKAKAIASWVSENILYDSSTSGDLFAQAPTIVLESKRAVCHGYAALTRALLQAAGIPALYISGYAIGFFSDNHAWNMAFVDGRWIYMDTTWGMDYFDQSIFYFAGSHRADSNLSAFAVSASANDTPSDWAKDEVWDAIASGLVPNNLQSAYRESITREEFCNLMVSLVENVSGQNIKTYLASKGLTITSSFADTQSKAVLATHALGIVNGTSENKFSPTSSITRQEAAVMLARTARILKIATRSSGNFTDAQQFAPWAADDISFVSGLTDPITGGKVMGGMGNGTFAPTAPYSREQAILTTLRIFHCAT